MDDFTAKKRVVDRNGYGKDSGIGMVFSIGNMQGMQMEDEDIVVLFGNLLENAIHECERRTVP